MLGGCGGSAQRSWRRIYFSLRLFLTEVRFTVGFGAGPSPCGDAKGPSIEARACFSVIGHQGRVAGTRFAVTGS